MRSCQLKCQKVFSLRACQLPLDAKTKAEVATDTCLDFGVIESGKVSN
jgi:hypothetical protein